MLAVKKHYGKEDGTIAYHGIQSFAPGEGTPELVHQIGVELATRLWGDRHQVLVATHLDTENHLHNHFIVNSVSLCGGKKYHRTKTDYMEMRRVSDEICREYGLSVIDRPSPMKGKHYGEYRAEQEGVPTFRSTIRAVVDEAIQQSLTERQFFDYLKKQGYEYKVGKYIAVKPPGAQRYFRLERQLGENYSIENIRKRILGQGYPKRNQLQQPTIRHAQLRGNYKKVKKHIGIRGLYFHYCYLLGVFPQHKPNTKGRLHTLLKQDLIKLDQITQEARLLGRHRIDTAEQLSLYQSKVEREIEALTARRTELYRQRRTVAVMEDQAKAEELKAAIANISDELKALRKEVKYCENIAVRSGVIEERIRLQREREEIKQKEVTRNEPLR